MLTSDDLIYIQFTNDLSEAGINYLCQILPFLNLRFGIVSIKNLRKNVCRFVVELAFRRYINHRQIPHENLVSGQFTYPFRTEISIGGRQCLLNVKTFKQADKILNIHNFSDYLIESSAVLDEDLIQSNAINKKNVLIFSILNTFGTPSIRSATLESKQRYPYFLIHTFPEKWSNPRKWKRIKEPTLCVSSKFNQKFVISGLGLEKDYLVEEINLNPNEKYRLKSDFYTLSWIQAFSPLDGKLKINIGSDQEYLIKPPNWSNIWIYGSEIILVGFLAIKEFTQIVNPDLYKNPIIGFERTRLRSTSIPVSELHPLQVLFSHAKIW